jgi:large subunit ribosomal protein L21
MDYAIVETGGKQYRVQPGQTISVEKIVADAGSTVELNKVLLVSQDDKVTVGQPLVEGARVLAEVANQGKADKVIVFKYKSKIRYSVKNGHRQPLTTLSIKEIVNGGSVAPRRRRQASGA